EAGAAVAINYRERAAEADALAKNIAGAGGRAMAIAADVSQTDAVAKMVDQVTSGLGPVDILVNNAGIAITRGVDDLTEEDFDKTIAVNLKSVFLITQAVLPGMRAKKWGRIVNISSGAARGAGAIGPHYNASKAGLEGLTRGYAARLVKEGITVNAVAPSLIETDMMQGQQQLVSRIPLGRFGTADEVASQLIVWQFLRDHLAIGELGDAAAAMQQHDFFETLVGFGILDHAQKRREPGASADQIEVAAGFEIVDDQRAGRLAADDDLVALLEMLEPRGQRSVRHLDRE